MTSCPSCDQPSRLTNGAEVYPHRRDLTTKPIWKCDGCGGYVGCHPGTTKALGTPAGPELRRARMMLHNQKLDTLWKSADLEPCYDRGMDKKRRKAIQSKARSRVYAYLAHRMGITADECHTGMFTLEQCRAAWDMLKNVTYMDIRRWAQQRDREAK